jgi:hypothetical protein
MEKDVSSKHVTTSQMFDMYLQIEKVLSSTPNPHEVMSKLLKSKVFEKAAREFFKQNGNVVSEKFESTEITISTTPSGNTFNIKNDIKKLLATREEGGLFDHRDGDITGWFGDVNFTDNEAVTGKVQIFKNAITYRDIIAEGENLGIYEEYELGQALLLANELVKAGAIEKKGCGVIIYLKNRKNGNRCHLFVWRHDNGKFGVDALKVDLGLNLEWLAGHGVLFSN